MNREIKFRGKSIMNNTCGDWLYSSGIKYGDDVELMYCDEDTSEEWNYIDKETLGQYTGLHDENGKEIYENDIVEFSYDIFTGNFDTKLGRGTIEFIDGAFYIKPFEIECKKIEDIDNGELFLLYTVNIDTLEIIGNIYDNPELLGGE